MPAIDQHAVEPSKTTRLALWDHVLSWVAARRRSECRFSRLDARLRRDVGLDDGEAERFRVLDQPVIRSQW